MPRIRFMIAAAAIAALPPSVPAQQPATDHASHHGTAPDSVAQAQSLADGEVRKVDKDAKKLTIKHGPIPNLDMPTMTMVYRVADPAMLDQVKAGDIIKFQAEKIDGAFTVTKIEAAK